MNDSPHTATTVSVVIPVYNRRNMIANAVDSVLSQEVPDGWDMEIVIVDDGSDDGTVERARESARADARVSVVTIDHCGMPGAVRNRGVESSFGELLAFLDSDDRWLPGKLRRQLALHSGKPDARADIIGSTGERASGVTAVRLSHTRERWIRDGIEVSQRGLRHRRRGDIFYDALEKCIIGPSTAMIERDLFLALGGFREDLEVAEDYEFWLRALCRTAPDYIDEPLVEKRAGEWDQLSSRYGQIEGFRIAALRDLVRSASIYTYRGEEDQRYAEQVLSRKLRIFAAGARKRGRTDEAARLTIEANSYEQ